MAPSFSFLRTGGGGGNKGGGGSSVCCMAMTQHPAMGKYHLVGRANGTVAMYHSDHSTPVAVWDDTCTGGDVVGGGGTSSGHVRNVKFYVTKYCIYISLLLAGDQTRPSTCTSYVEIGFFYYQ
jgi:hypothetical protein